MGLWSLILILVFFFPVCWLKTGEINKQICTENNEISVTNSNEEKEKTSEEKRITHPIRNLLKNPTFFFFFSVSLKSSILIERSKLGYLKFCFLQMICQHLGSVSPLSQETSVKRKKHSFAWTYWNTSHCFISTTVPQSGYVLAKSQLFKQVLLLNFHSKKIRWSKY